MFKLLPKDDKFFEDLEALAASVRTSAGHLNELIEHFPEIGKELTALELERQSARQRMQMTMARLDKAFITPLDREDILDLIVQMRAVVDRVADLAQRFRFYRLSLIYPNLSSQSANLFSLAKEVQAIIGHLRQDTSLKSAAERLDATRALIERVKQDRELFLSELFAGEPNPIDLIKKKELHDLLDDALKRLDNVTLTLAAVLLKNG
jgi:uncharacterized protein Yka (UPF0111/DUF47 family)